MNIKKDSYFIVNSEQNWQKDHIYLLGNEKTPRYYDLMNRNFMIPADNHQMIPMNVIAEGMTQYINTQQKPEFIPNNYHLDPSKTLGETIPMMRTQLTLIRELIFEEVRIHNFPEKFSRYKGVQVIPPAKESLSFWLPKLKTPHAKIYRVELTGKTHRGDLELLGTNSIPTESVRMNAFQYWLGTEGSEAASDETIFQGLAKVVEIIDATAMASK